MKKLFAIVLALMLCVSALSVAVFAAPQGLNSLAIVGTGIPGVAEWDPADPAGDMDEVSDSVYVIELACPAGTNFSFKVAGNDAWDDAFNFGSATIVFGQTADLENGGSSSDMAVSVDHDCTLKITVDLNPMAEGGAATILVEENHDTSDTPDTPDAPVGDYESSNANGLFAAPSSLAIVGSGIPGVGEWNPADPAGDMTANGLVYEIELSCPAGTAMNFKFAGNDAWDDSCNLGSGTAAIGSTTNLVNDGGSSDMTLSVDKDCVLKFTVDLTALADMSGAATLTIAEVDGGSTENPDDQPGEDNPPAEGNVKVHARIPESWGENPCFWAWNMADNTNAFSTWPGEVMTKNGEWFEIEIPNWCDGVIVNDGGSTQTPDLQVEAGKEIWIDVYTYEDVKVTYSDPGERVEPTEPSEDPTEPSEEPTEPSETEPSETEPSETQPTESNKDKENNDKELRAKKKTHTILIIVMVVVWVVVVAELITILLKKKL